MQNTFMGAEQKERDKRKDREWCIKKQNKRGGKERALGVCVQVSFSKFDLLILLPITRPHRVSTVWMWPALLS